MRRGTGVEGCGRRHRHSDNGARRVVGMRGRRDREGKSPDLRGGDPKKRDSKSAFRRPFSRLGNAHAGDVSVLRPSERGGGAPQNWPVFGGKPSDSSGGGPRKTRLRFCVPAPVFSTGKRSRRERKRRATLGRHRGGPRVLPGFGAKLSDFWGVTPKNRTHILHTGGLFLSWETLTPSA